MSAILRLRIDAIGDANRISAQEDLAGIEALRHQAPLAHKQQVAWSRKHRFRVYGHNQRLRVLWGIQICDIDAGFVPAIGSIENVSAVRQEPRRCMRKLTPGPVG